MVTCRVCEPMFLLLKVAVTCITATPVKLAGDENGCARHVVICQRTKVLLVSTGNVTWNFLPVIVALTTNGPVLVRTFKLNW